MEAPRCPLCGGKHWSRQPCVGAARRSDSVTEIKTAKPAVTSIKSDLKSVTWGGKRQGVGRCKTSKALCAAERMRRYRARRKVVTMTKKVIYVDPCDLDKFDKEASDAAAKGDRAAFDINVGNALLLARTNFKSHDEFMKWLRLTVGEKNKAKALEYMLLASHDPSTPHFRTESRHSGRTPTPYFRVPFSRGQPPE